MRATTAGSARALRGDRVVGGAEDRHGVHAGVAGQALHAHVGVLARVAGEARGVVVGGDRAHAVVERRVDRDVADRPVPQAGVAVAADVQEPLPPPCGDGEAVVDHDAVEVDASRSIWSYTTWCQLPSARVVGPPTISVVIVVLTPDVHSICRPPRRGDGQQVLVDHVGGVHAEDGTGRSSSS
jgi:hypothetical protein